MPVGYSIDLLFAQELKNETRKIKTKKRFPKFT